MAPNSYKRGPSEENDIQRAIRHLNLNPHLKIKPVAREFNVGYQKLMARRNGRKPSNTRGGTNKKLAEPLNEALIDYLEMLYQNGTPADVQHLILAGNRILYYTGLDESVSRR
jgi:hypothetical protein